MGTARSSRKRKGAAAVARKRPAVSTVKRKPSPAGKAARATSRGPAVRNGKGSEAQGQVKKDRAAAIRGSGVKDESRRAAGSAPAKSGSRSGGGPAGGGSDRSGAPGQGQSAGQAAQAQADRSPPALPIPIASFTF